MPHSWTAVCLDDRQPERYHPMKNVTMPTGTDLLGEFEEHSPAGIRALPSAGVSRLSLLTVSDQLTC
jgi:hypothetical protein